MAAYTQPTGDYAITEQGDLGLGLTPIDEGVLKEQKPVKKDKEERK